MNRFEIKKNALTAEQMESYRKMNEGHDPTGDVLVENLKEGQIVKPIFKGKFTHSVRDCGDHYIIARYSQFDRLEKDTLELTEDVEDR